MLSQNELKLLENPGIAKFPLLSAVKNMLKNCGKCGHRNVNINNALRLAVNKYKRDPGFVSLCKGTFAVPAMVGGVLVQ